MLFFAVAALVALANLWNWLAFGVKFLSIKAAAFLITAWFGSVLRSMTIKALGQSSVLKKKFTIIKPYNMY